MPATVSSVIETTVQSGTFTVNAKRNAAENSRVFITLTDANGVVAQFDVPPTFMYELSSMLSKAMSELDDARTKLMVAGVA